MKIAILGLGPSLKLFNHEDFEDTIGVNDIWRYYHSRNLVVLNHQHQFTPDRYRIIKNSKPEKFYSQIVNWDYRPDFVKINLLPGYPDNHINLDIPGYYKSYCSPFVACQIAFKEFKANEIHLFGIDMTNHPNLNITLCGKIKGHFRNLKKALEAKGCKMIVHGEGILKNI